VEHEALDAEASLASLGDLMLDVVQITVVDVHGPALDPEPRAAVEHSAAPAADRRDLAGPAEAAEVIGIEPAAVVHGEIPVAVRPAGAAGPGAAKGDGQHVRQACQPAGDVLSKLLVSHRRQDRPGPGRGHANKITSPAAWANAITWLSHRHHQLAEAPLLSRLATA